MNTFELEYRLAARKINKWLAPLKRILLENRIFYRHNVKIFVPSSGNAKLLIGIIEWLANNVENKSYCIKIKTVPSNWKRSHGILINLDTEWGNNITILFKNLNDAIQYKLIWS